MKKSRHLDTVCLHGGAQYGDERKALSPPIHMSTSFTFDSLEDAELVMDFKSDDFVYTRGNNPTLRLFETRIAEMEGGTAGAAFSSGMAAISSVLLSLTKQGDHIVAHRTLYGSTHTVLTELLPRYGITAHLVNCCTIEELTALLDQLKGKGITPKALFFETPANPSLEVIPIAVTAQVSRQYGMKLIVDNTFSSPALQQPLLLGADIVVHSATKYLCGHGDALGGAAVSKDSEYIQRLKFGFMCELGGVMSPFNAWLILRGMKTLTLRMERHCSSAHIIARRLSDHPKVSRVHYPGLPEDAHHSTAAEQMTGFGGMISFELAGGHAAAASCINALELFKRAVSLGDCESLVQFPAGMTHRGYDEKDLELCGLSKAMLRVSIGLEHPEDLWDDLEYALQKVSTET